MMEKKIAFACDTPLQILNAINLQESYFANCESDIFVYNQFYTAGQIVKKLENANIFRKVYLIGRYKEYSGNLQKFVTFKRMMYPHTTLNRYVVGNNKINKEKYDSVVFSFITTFSITVFGMSKANEFIQLEDGIGTYVGDILSDYTSGLFKKIISGTKYKHLLKPEKVCVYNPEIYAGSTPIIKLKSEFSKILRDKIEFVYDYMPNDVYKSNKYIYLSQPIQEVEGYSQENHESIKQLLRKYRQQVLVRIHPREEVNLYKDLQIDSVKNLWELECIHQIDDDSVLIGGFSTAQIMPKVFKNKEPYLILLYKLLIENTDTEYWNQIGCFIEQFRSFYSHPEKIYVPQSICEFEQILSEIFKKSSGVMSSRE